MRNLLVPALLFASVAAVPALAASPVHSFSQDGNNYEYTTSRTSKGAIVISGRDRTTGDNFTLRVVDRHVDGYVGSHEVSFGVTSQQIAQLQQEVGGSTALASN